MSISKTLEVIGPDATWCGEVVARGTRPRRSKDLEVYAKWWERLDLILILLLIWWWKFKKKGPGLPLYLCFVLSRLSEEEWRAWLTSDLFPHTHYFLDDVLYVHGRRRTHESSGSGYLWMGVHVPIRLVVFMGWFQDPYCRCMAPVTKRAWITGTIAI